MMQLKPCMGRYICQEPLNNDFKLTHVLASRWSMFKIILLEKNHRQGNDQTYAEILNRIRIGEHTKEDLDVLRKRVRPQNHQDIKTANTFLVCKRKQCAQINKRHLNKLDGDLLELQAKHHCSTQPKYKPYIEPKEGAVASTSMIDKLKLKIGAKVMLIHNIDTSDHLTNGQLGQLAGVIKTTSGEIDKLLIRFDNEKVGRNSKEKHPLINAKYPDCIVIDRVALQYTLRKKSGDVGTTATVIQFPIKLAFAITSHKIQGQTIKSPKKVVLDIHSVFEDAQAYVMLSRVQQLEQVFILGVLEESKIRTSKIALQELHRMRLISANRNPSPWQKDQENVMKIVSLNCAGLAPHFIDIMSDEHMMKADVIHLIETSLVEGNDEQFQIPGYISHFITVGKGKGLATYFKQQVIQHDQDIKEQNMQLTKFSCLHLDLINVYRSQNGNSVELLNHIVKMTNEDKPTLITGDFNICYMTHKNNRMSKGLEKNLFTQQVQEATHIQGGHIDHAYWKDKTGVWSNLVIERYSPYYSDHDAICITLTKPSEDKRRYGA